jgi:hypothetical protein
VPRLAYAPAGCAPAGCAPAGCVKLDAPAARRKSIICSHIAQFLFTLEIQLRGIARYREYAHFAAPEFLELFVTGLRLAGLPEK